MPLFAHPFPPSTNEQASGQPVGESHCRIIMDGPGSEADVLNDIFCGVVNAARQSVRIMTPYFLPTHGFMSALRSAVEGAQVFRRYTLFGLTLA